MLFAAPFIHRVFWGVDGEYLYGISRANEDALIPSITTTIYQGESNDTITCEEGRGTKVLLRPYTIFMIPQQIVFVCANIDESGVVKINCAGHIRQPHLCDS